VNFQRSQRFTRKRGLPIVLRGLRPRSVPETPETECGFFEYAAFEEIARHETETSPGTAGVGRRRFRYSAGDGRAGYRPIVAGAGDCRLERIPATPLALSVAVA
jgi:hypothetical protein